MEILITIQELKNCVPYVKNTFQIDNKSQDFYSLSSSQKKHREFVDIVVIFSKIVLIYSKIARKLSKTS